MANIGISDRMDMANSEPMADCPMASMNDLNASATVNFRGSLM